MSTVEELKRYIDAGEVRKAKKLWDAKTSGYTPEEKTIYLKGVMDLIEIASVKESVAMEVGAYMLAGLQDITD